MSLVNKALNFSHLYWIDGTNLRDNGNEKLCDLSATTSLTANRTNRLYPANTTRVEVERIQADCTIDTNNNIESFSIGYKNPHIKAQTLYVWDETKASDQIPDINKYALEVPSVPTEPTAADIRHTVRLQKRLSNIRDYYDVYNPTESSARVLATNINVSGIPLSQVSFRIENILTSADFSASEFASYSGELYLKFDVAAEDYDANNPFQGNMVAALVGATPYSTGHLYGENSFVVTDAEHNHNTNGRDMHGFTATENDDGTVTANLPIKYLFCTLIEEKFNGTRTYGIWIPHKLGFELPDGTSETAYNLYITPGWWDFRGKVTFSNFRLTNSKINERFRPDERMADQGLVNATSGNITIPGWMKLNENGTSFELFSDYTNPAVRASANNMLLSGYDIATTNNSLVVHASTQTYTFDVSGSCLNIGLVRNNTGGDQNVGIVRIKDADPDQISAVYSLSILDGYTGTERNTMVTGYYLLRNYEQIALIRINGDGTIMVQSLIQISNDEYSDEECVDNTSVGLKIEYFPPEDITTFPVDYYMAGCGIMQAIGEKAGLDIHAIHHRTFYDLAEPFIERGSSSYAHSYGYGRTQTFSGARSMVCPPVWYENDKPSGNPHSIQNAHSADAEHFAVWPFYRQSVWINVTPPKEHSVSPDTYKSIYHIYRSEHWGELFPTQNVIQSWGHSAPQAANIWENRSKIIIINSEKGLWRAWGEDFVPRELNDYVTSGFSWENNNQTRSFYEFMSACKDSGKKVLLYTTSDFFLKGSCHANNTQSASYHYFAYSPSHNGNGKTVQLGMSDQGINPIPITETPETYSAYVNQWKILNCWCGFSNGDNVLEYITAIDNLLSLMVEQPNETSSENYLGTMGFYLDGLYMSNHASAYYVIRKLREMYWQKCIDTQVLTPDQATTPQQPTIIYHGTLGTIGSTVFQPIICEAYADLVLKAECNDNMEMYRTGVTPDGAYPSSASPSAISIENLFKYVYSAKYRSNSDALWNMGQVTSYDCESNVKDANGKTFAKILDQNFAYTEKYGVFIPYPEGLTVTMDPEKPELKEAYSTYEAWILKRGYDWEHMLPYDININELQTCWASGPDIVVSGSIVTILPGTVISLPNWAVLKFHDGEQKYRLIIGTHGATTPVVIRPKNETTGEHWTGFAFEPGDRYGDGPDGVIEILSPFEFRGMRKPYRFHQITKNAQIFV